MDEILLNLEGHGREALDTEVDISRTVGWFTTIYPVAIAVKHPDDAIRQLIEVKETLHRIPNKGIGYGILRYLSGKPYDHQPEITFNYLGDFGAEAPRSNGKKERKRKREQPLLL